jgi:hypothetical protein
VLREKLEDVLIDRAAWARTRLEAGRKHGVELYEETITQDLLLDISVAFPAMSVQTFTKREEGRNGADWQWEWWFEGRRWFGLRIQAKRLKPLSSHQPGYDLGYIPPSRKRRQIDLLLADARRVGMQAAYVLYNGPDLDSVSFAWRCHRLPPKAAFFGISLLPATIARELVDAGTVDLTTVGSRSRPWSCLASCASSGCRSLLERSWLNSSGIDDTDLPWWVALSFFRMELQARGETESDEFDAAAVPRVLPGMRDRPPAYVIGLLNQDFVADGALPPRVGALTVFRAESRRAHL